MATQKPTTLNKPPVAKKPAPSVISKSQEKRLATQKGEKPPREKDPLEKMIAEQAQARFVASAAIDAAVAMREAGIRQPLNATQTRAKLRVKTADVKDELLLRIAEGQSLFTICQDAHMPARSQVYKFIREDAQFRAEYECALDQRADKYVEQIADLSRHMQDRAAMGASNEEVTALKAHINSLQWIAARLNPKKYGDKQQLDIDQKVTLDEKQLDQRLNALIAKAKPKAAE